jgi:hypothetical protein
MDPALAKAIADIEAMFAGYPRRAVLEGCPHCVGDVRVEDHDLFSLTIRLGNTIGTEADVKALLPTLLRNLVTGDELDPGIVLGKVAPSWLEPERLAVERFLDVVWQRLLAEFPPNLGAFHDVPTFLRAVPNPDHFLASWPHGSAPDRHLAAYVLATTDDWAHRNEVRDRLLEAFERDQDEPWADEFAVAHDFV